MLNSLELSGRTGPFRGEAASISIPVQYCKMEVPSQNPPEYSDITPPKPSGGGVNQGFVSDTWRELAQARCRADMFRALIKLDIGVNEVEDDFEFEFYNEEEDATNQEQAQEEGKVSMDKFGWFYKVRITFTRSMLV